MAGSGSGKNPGICHEDGVLLCLADDVQDVAPKVEEIARTSSSLALGPLRDDSNVV